MDGGQDTEVEQDLEQPRDEPKPKLEPEAGNTTTLHHTRLHWASTTLAYMGIRRRDGDTHECALVAFVWTLFPQ